MAQITVSSTRGVAQSHGYRGAHLLVGFGAQYLKKSRALLCSVKDNIFSQKRVVNKSQNVEFGKYGQ